MPIIPVSRFQPKIYKHHCNIRCEDQGKCPIFKEQKNSCIGCDLYHEIENWQRF